MSQAVTATGRRAFGYVVGACGALLVYGVHRFAPDPLRRRLWAFDHLTDLLIIDLPNDDGWSRLCPFLGHPTPNEPFPHANKASWSRKLKNYLNNR